MPRLTSGQYYIGSTIVNYESRVALDLCLNYDSGVVNYHGLGCFERRYFQLYFKTTYLIVE